ncbi:hypothetical protein SDC9_137561 [bioreactor metagenome]|uniref:Na+/H+ antiporter NhaC-like C-terminal domain-containing protein n=1 Tax=bioreactor metagenome TaxID=1076179 RepID=A0A645DLW4_9ZZZZ
MLTWDSIKECFSSADASIVIFQVALFCCVIAIVMGLWQKVFKLDEAVNIFVTGVKSLIITCVILILAWSLSSTIKELGTAKFLVSALSDSVPKFLLPAIIFILGSIISFATGTSYGTMGILMPLAIPFAVAMPGADLDFVVMCSGGVLTGAIFGDHCSPISDTTILSSMGAGCDHIEHVNTQIWYALSMAAVALIFGYIPVGLGLNVWVSLLIGLIAVFAVLYFFGKKADAQEPVSQSETVQGN